MKVLLRKDYESLGQSGDVVDVKPGFARNFLIPQQIVLPLTKGNKKILEEEQIQTLMQGKRVQLDSEELAKKLEKVSVTATVTVGEDDRIFGTVTNQNISDLLREKGFEIDKKVISLDEPVKALGIYPVTIKLHQNVETKIKLWVVKG
ncbi:50S ribosomal protein L9 [candidate division KSB1 bacterium]|nr:50S ribosomal protein L9 [candidate division KSB1 bacterium]